MENIKSILILLFLCLVVGCTSPDNQKEVSLINQAESMLESDPQQAYALLDSVEFPEELSSKQEARWCMLVGKLAIPYQRPFLIRINSIWQTDTLNAMAHISSGHK